MPPLPLSVPVAWLQWFFAILLAILYALVLFAMKLWLYPGWTWRGYFTDLKVLAALAVLLIPLPANLWRVHRRQSPNESFPDTLLCHLPLSHPETAVFLAFLTSLTLLFFLFLFLIGERDPSYTVIRYARQSNWIYAQNALDEFRRQPIRPRLIETLQHFITIHRVSENDELSRSQHLREDRDAVVRLLDEGHDFHYLNTLSYAEYSKALFYIEDDPGPLNEGIKRLISRVISTSDPRTLSPLLLKIGELELAVKDYSRARLYLQFALGVESDPTAAARIRANIGNTYAAEEKLKAAGEAYLQAEQYYPEGRRHVFYSNYGYLLMLGGDYETAKTKVQQALKINPDDWYSHLNLGLINDELGQHDDAIVSYQLVIKKSINPDSRREAQILAGRSAELAGRPFDEYVAFYLAAGARSTAQNRLDALRNDSTELAKLYRETAGHLIDTNTHAIERYVEWFQAQAHNIEIQADTIADQPKDSLRLEELIKGVYGQVRRRSPGGPIEFIGLTGNKVPDGFWVLLEKETELTNIHLRHCNVTDKDLIHLYELDKLENIDIRDTTVTRDGIARLR